MKKALTGFNKHYIRFVKLEYNMDNLDLKHYTGKSFLSVHISDMHEIRMNSNTGYYTREYIMFFIVVLEHHVLIVVYYPSFFYILWLLM